MSNIDWNNLGFDIMKTNAYLKFTYKNGNWDAGVLCRNTEISISIFASPFHYGQACFEGLKAFTCKDNRIRIFRPDLNAVRLQQSCAALSMPAPTIEMFVDGVKRVVEENREFVPPYGVNGSLYIRPFLFGVSPVLGLDPSSEYCFMIFGNPVGNYYKGGLQPRKALIQHGFDRSAPFGMGKVKLAGNYAPTMAPSKKAIDKGYTVLLFLDPREQKYVDEFATSNFAALTKPNKDGKRTYVTPSSTSILVSITNRSLSELAAKRFGWNVERRRVLWEEVKNGAFDEVAACGTAVVVTLINKIDREYLTNDVDFCATKTDIDTLWDDLEVEPDLSLEEVELQSDFTGFTALYEIYRGIQNGELPDEFNWMYPKEGIER